MQRQQGRGEKLELLDQHDLENRDGDSMVTGNYSSGAFFITQL